MHYRFFILLISFSILSGQSLFNRWIGTDPFAGSARSTAMGNTHLLNSSAGSLVRFNPAKLGLMKTSREFSVQINRNSIFERWSMPIRDSFDEFLTNADYVANEFNYYNLSFGFIESVNTSPLGKVGIGYNYAPLTQFIYQYSEEVRGSYSIEDGEYASKDPIVGYQNLSSDGKLMVSSIGSGVTLELIEKMNFSLGGAINLIHSAKLRDRVEVDTLYSDVTNLTTFSDWNSESELPTSNFLSFSSIIKVNSNVILGVSWESNLEVASQLNQWEIDTTNGLFQYWNDTSFAVNGLKYMKPEARSLAVSYNSNNNNEMSINFEMNQVLYNEYLIFQNYKHIKFGFEYFTQMGTPIRGGLIYKTPAIPALKPISTFTVGSGKSMGKLNVDYSATYCFQSFYYPDLFPVDGDIRSENDFVRDSQLNLQFNMIYKF